MSLIYYRKFGDISHFRWIPASRTRDLIDKQANCQAKLITVIETKFPQKLEDSFPGFVRTTFPVADYLKIGAKKFNLYFNELRAKLRLFLFICQIS